MKLEDEIKQKSFKSPYQKLAVNLLYTNNWLSKHYDGFFKGLDLTIQQYNVLRILRGQSPTPCNLKLVKDRMLDPMSDASRILDKLVVKDYAIRGQCNDDRRSVNLLITEKGLKLLEQLDFIDDSTEEIFKNLPFEKINLLNALLDELRG